VDKYGSEEELRKQGGGDLQGEWVAETRILDRATAVRRRTSATRRAGGAQSTAAPTVESSEFERFRKANVSEQKQDGFVTGGGQGQRGDLTPEHVPGHGRQIMRSYSGGYARRTTVQQKLVLRGVRAEGGGVRCMTLKGLSGLAGVGDAAHARFNDVC